MHRHDAGVRQTGENLRLVLEALGLAGVLVLQSLRQDFDGDGPVQRALPAFVNRAHAALPQQALDVILGQQFGKMFRAGPHPLDTAACRALVVAGRCGHLGHVMR